MKQDVIGPSLVLLIVIIGLVVVVSGGNSGKALRYLFAPVFWIIGNLFRLAILCLVGFIAFQFLPGHLVDGIVSHYPATAEISIPKFAYPVGEKNAKGVRDGENWRVSQDFSDSIKPVTHSLSGQHLGEDWVPTLTKAAGQPVFAIAKGQVILNEQNDSYGRVLMIRHEAPGTPYSKVISLYGHIRAKEGLGPTVHQGEQVGTIATREWNGCNAGCQFTAPGCKPKPDSGKSSSECHGWDEHLHFELRSPEASETIGFGYSTSQEGFLNPTDRGSTTENSGNGWIDKWQN